MFSKQSESKWQQFCAFLQFSKYFPSSTFINRRLSRLSTARGYILGGPNKLKLESLLCSQYFEKYRTLDWFCCVLMVYCAPSIIHLSYVKLSGLFKIVTKRVTGCLWMKKSCHVYIMQLKRYFTKKMKHMGLCLFMFLWQF